MKTAEIRQKFIAFFESHGHQPVASSPLIPANDPTLLFTNAGMVQFKEVFLGNENRPYLRAVSSQRSLRAGGKHNDLENVGYTARHHTFFEMLGNFSFGDYFKKEAIQLAWQLLTQEYCLPAEKLWVTVYFEDDEAFNIWHHDIGLAPERIIRIGDNKGARFASDNFWQMADTGPCGPCSEIFYDHGAEITGGLPGSPDEDGDRYIEIWNIVFMQFNRTAEGAMEPLPKPSVDTGMGLERIAAVLQGVHSNYEIDLFQSLIHAAARETQTADYASPSLKVLADHIRACVFLMVDGIIPGNEGRGYVLRRIIRRAIRHGYKLGARSPFFHRMVPDLVREMGVAYPELIAAQSRVQAMLAQEEERFFLTIEHGMSMLESELADMRATSKTKLDGNVAFKLHDTFGFPLDLTADVCRERQMTVDEATFDRAMAEQKRQARAQSKFKMSEALEYHGEKTIFQGYDHHQVQTTVVALYHDGMKVEALQVGQSGVVVLKQTPFYAESGGQVGDRGILKFDSAGASNSGAFTVDDTQKIRPEVVGHYGEVANGTLQVGMAVNASVDRLNRIQIMRHHSATHLLHKSLREILGEHVQQKGSQVSADKTRFDFTHNQPLTLEERLDIERLVNAEIVNNSDTRAEVMAIEEAKSTGAMMLFGEKYGDEVRVLSIGSSKELCGGTHVARTGDIGFFKITNETGVASGVRRIEAQCGELALVAAQREYRQLNAIAQMTKSAPEMALDRLNAWQEEIKLLQREKTELARQLAQLKGSQLLSRILTVKGVQVLAECLGAIDAKMLRESFDNLRAQVPNAVLVLAGINEGKVNLIAGIPPNLVSSMKAGELVNAVAQQVGGKGGGKADVAMAGGTQPERINSALESVSDWVKSKIIP
jgi:alanyl-tRNA synthetase